VFIINCPGLIVPIASQSTGTAADLCIAL